MTEETNKTEKEELPINHLVNVFAEQQNITLNKLNKEEEKNDDATNDGSTKGV